MDWRSCTELPTLAARFPSPPRLGSGCWDTDSPMMRRWPTGRQVPVVGAPEHDDLLSVLGLGRCERRHCRVWRWLFDPYGGHGFGELLVQRFTERVGVHFDAPHGWRDVSVTVEEPARATRADLTIRVGDRTVVVETKVDAVERPAQCAALEAAWPNADRLVFVTLDGRAPTTAGSRPWVALAWSDLVADLVETLGDTDGGVFGVESTGRRSAAAYFDSALRHLCVDVNGDPASRETTIWNA